MTGLSVQSLYRAEGPDREQRVGKATEKTKNIIISIFNHLNEALRT